MYEVSREPLNGFASHSRGRRVWSFSRTSLKVKIKGQGSRSPGQTAFSALSAAACDLCLVKHLSPLVFGRPLVKRFTLCYRTVVLSMTLVYCGQTVEWIKLPLGMEVGLGPGHIVLDGIPGPTERRTTAPSNLFGACLSLLCSGRGFCTVDDYITYHPVLVARTQPRPMSIVAKRSPISATAEHLFFLNFTQVFDG